MEQERKGMKEGGDMAKQAQPGGTIFIREEVQRGRKGSEGLKKR